MKVIRITLKTNASTESWKYLKECARARDITMTSLFKRIIDDTAKERLVDSILDDKDHLLDKRTGEHRYRDLA